MKTGAEIRDRALTLLHYVDQAGRLRSDLYADLYARSLDIVNQIYGDLWYTTHTTTFEQLGSLADTVMLPGRIREDVMPYGVAMLMAQTIGDGDNQNLYASLYSRKRTRAASQDCRVDIWSKGGRRCDDG